MNFQLTNCQIHTVDYYYIIIHSILSHSIVLHPQQPKFRSVQNFVVW